MVTYNAGNETPGPLLNCVEDGLPLGDAGEWSREKLFYVKRYIEIFTKAMRNKWIMNYIDLFSGPGKSRIGKSDEIILGSPLIALTTQYKFFKYYFNDNDEIKINALKTRCASSDVNHKVDFSCGDANISVTKIVKEIQESDSRRSKSLSLAFLDPYGLHLNWATIETLAKIKCDILIYFTDMGLKRVMPNQYQSEKTNLIDNFFGSKDWRKIYEDYRKGEQFHLIRSLLDFYKNQLKELGFENYESPEPEIRSSKKNAPLYRLILASSHIRAHEFWEEATKRDFYGQKKLFDRN
jgi:three-Cys-motif partner protein